MLILGADLSLSSTGYALYDTEKKSIIKAFRVTTTPDMDIYARILDIIDQPDCYADAMVFEEGYIGASGKTSIQLAMLRGAFVYASDRQPCYGLQSKEIRRILTGSGSTNKEEMAGWIVKHYRSDIERLGIGAYSDKTGKHKTSDIYDAIAVALAYAKKMEGKE